MGKKRKLHKADNEGIIVEEDRISSELADFIKETEREIEQGRMIPVEDYAKRRGISL